jgi:hypothetical protein
MLTDTGQSAGIVLGSAPRVFKGEQLWPRAMCVSRTVLVRDPDDTPRSGAERNCTVGAPGHESAMSGTRVYCASPGPSPSEDLVSNVSCCAGVVFFVFHLHRSRCDGVRLPMEMPFAKLVRNRSGFHPWYVLQPFSCFARFLFYVVLVAMESESVWNDDDRLIYWMEWNSWQEANQWREWRAVELFRLKQEVELHLQESRFAIQKCELAVRDMYQEVQEYVQSVQHIVGDLRVQQRSLFEFTHSLQEALDYQRGCEYELKQYICVLEQSLFHMQQHNYLLQVQVAELEGFKVRALIEQAANESEYENQICSLEEDLFLMEIHKSMLEAREVSLRTANVKLEVDLASLQTSNGHLNKEIGVLLDYKKRHTRTPKHKRTRKGEAAAAGEGSNTD